MAFSNRRGRPRTKVAGSDLGTPELQYKRLINETTEPFDLCLKKSFININQHSAGLRLRWLYVLRFGVPTVSAYNPNDGVGISTRKIDEDWSQERQEEYLLYTDNLHKIGAKTTVFNICILHNWPLFLNPHPEKSYIIKNYEEANFQLTKLREGLDIIDNLGQKYTKSKKYHTIMP
ncbi:hypothetical protein N9W34_02880 [Rickettsiales bacterium]|nr:hypothetical protein [Rickettsiales bacterium]